ncbi:MAG: Rrf2 family transcriptional regulator [Desulfobacter sp.]
MRLITQTRYGIRILLDLAMHQSEGVVQMSDIATRQNISLKYLERIIQPLKKAGFVYSKRGRSGGHTLALPPEGISLAEVVRIFEPDARQDEEPIGASGYPEFQDALIRDAWQDAKEAFYSRLDKVSLADLSINTTRKLWSHSDILVFCE